MSGLVNVNIQPGRILASNCTLKLLIELAYGADDHRLTNLSTWADSLTYDIDARIDEPTMNQILKLGDDDRKRAYQQMSQAMLADRCQLKLHRETRELPIYSLIIAKNGHKLHPATPGETYANGTTTPEGVLLGPNTVGFKADSELDAVVTGQAATIQMFVDKIKGWLSREVIDNTGLQGNYDFALKFHWGQGVDRPPTLDDQPSGTSIFTAIQNQLGLKLEARKGQVEILVVDQIEKPTPN